MLCQHKSHAKLQMELHLKHQGAAVHLALRASRQIFDVTQKLKAHKTHGVKMVQRRTFSTLAMLQ